MGQGWTGPIEAQLIVALLTGIATPLAVLWLGSRIQHQIKHLEESQWANQKVIEKRLERFDCMGPLLNDLYCYFQWFGNWKEQSPSTIIGKKRILDREMGTYRFLFSEALYLKYDRFMKACFRAGGGGPGGDAMILTAVCSYDGNREQALRSTASERWETLDDKRFDFDCQYPSDEKQGCRCLRVANSDIREPTRTAYDQLMDAFAQDVSLDGKRVSRE